MIRSWSIDNGTDSNDNISVPIQKLNWGFGPIFLITVTCVAFILNVAVLLLFICVRRLRSLFALYICALLLSNVIFCATNDWMIVTNQLFGTWPLSYAACTLHMYAAWVWTGVTMHLHLLITINRIWAISFPHSYRNHHNIKSALIMMGLITAYVHIMCLPGVVLDALYYRVPDGCSLNTDKMIVWDAVVMIVIYDAPIAVMAGALPFLWYQQHRKRRLVSVTQANELTRKATAVAHSSAPNEVFEKGTRERQRSGHRGFAVLTALTISVILSWTPNQIYYTIAVFRDVDNAVVRQFAFILYSLQAIADPVLIVLTFQEASAVLKRLTLCDTSTWRP
ncbi:uncharacterized protein LOC129588297 [Paramacrobiotus metropolitanus]|uniref:uncharacterized protein LOC129588297 n=1 Tax=Paramacrobiotus metropolitanus TaxID=2943436 RepID=UPI0024457DF1|nr:uncharacterized protein LOC129588297 [Paramacrobiotus metropolitanus]